ncbi:MAG: right-handed parallel beta-helix repeat-containing protein [Verrucomicrobia bacterium]|nr:right-handed parallel beta-helix repeat-containing protein [Verrucomicrobiota bacterium]
MNPLPRSAVHGWSGRPAAWVAAWLLLLLIVPLPSGLAATFTVTNTNDSGPGSLRQALIDSDGSGDTIVFNIPGTGVKKIAPLTNLPQIQVISGAFVIDGSSQPGWTSGNPVIELSGENIAGSGAIGLAFNNCRGGFCTVRGLIINRFEGSGIRILDSAGLLIEGCFIGTDASGSFAQPNGTGVEVRQFVNDPFAPTRDVTVGGNTAGRRNVISGNRSRGLYFFLSTACTISGNYIGTDKTGRYAVPNGTGINLFAVESTVGGATAADGNVIAGNSGTGVQLDLSGHTVENNFIGLGADGATPLPNNRGIECNNGFVLNAQGNHRLANNQIAHHPTDGIRLFAATVPLQGISISSNAIHSNAGRGINLTGTNAIPDNDPGDGDSGGNRLQNFPVLTSAVVGASTTTVLGTLQSEPASSYRVEFFANPGSAREGRRFLGALNVLTDGTGQAGINVALPALAYSGEFVTATATRNVAPLDTSEFSVGVPVVVTVFKVTNTNDSGAGSLRQAILDANASPDPNEIVFEIPPVNSTVRTISPVSALPIVTQPVAIRGLTQGTPGATTPRIVLSGVSAGGGAHGLNVTADRCRIEGLVINGFGGNGLLLNTSNFSAVVGNRIGTSSAGNAAVPNGGDGLALTSSSQVLVSGNLLSGNTGAGLRVNGGANATVQSNLIGVDIRQNGPLANAGGGALFLNSGANLIGGSAATRNVLGGNGVVGLGLSGASCSGNRIAANVIGTNDAGTATNLGNAVGVLLGAAVSANFLGGTATGEGNTIAFNTGQGVFVAGTAGLGNRVLGNAIYSNGALGIDLVGDGITANDANDADTGANGLQNFPILSAAEAYFAGLTLRGSLNSVASQVYRLEFFASPTCDSSGQGEGASFVGSLDVTTDATGNVSFNQTFPVALAVGQVVTATATRLATGDTSEFSACRTVTALTLPVLTVTNTADSGPGSLRQALLDTNAAGAPRQIVFNIPGAGVKTIVPATALPSATSGVVLDALTQPGATAAAPLIELDGNFATPAGTHGLHFQAGAIVRGLSVGRFRGDGMRFDTLGNNAVYSCRIGTDATGLLDRGNGRNGLYFESVGDNTIGGPGEAGNIVTGNTRLSISGGGQFGDANIQVAFSPGGNRIQNNRVGTTLAGAALPASRNGIVIIGGVGNVIGGDATERNVVNNAGYGIVLRNTSGGVVQGNYVGLGADGNAQIPQQIDDNGIRIENAEDSQVLDNAVGRVRSTANGGAGICVTGSLATGAVVSGNRIGTNAAGTAAAGNLIGVLLQFGAEATVGGLTPAARNVIAGNDNQGILVTNGLSTGTPPTGFIFGNYVGLGADGSTILANGTGIEIQAGITGVQIGGASAGSGNVIAGNAVGVSLASAGHLLTRNFFGTDATGTLGRPGGTGLLLRSGAAGCTIGGASAANANVFAAHTVAAIATETGATNAGGHTLRFNRIGTAADGVSPLPNAAGIRLESSGNALLDNLVAHSNPGAGVVILPAGTGNTLSRNSIHSNAGLGIDLGGDGVTANDADDADTGANLRQNFPVLTRAGYDLRGTYQGAANVTLKLQFFLGPAGSNQGRTFLGETTITTSGTGAASFTYVPGGVTLPLALNQVVTATATDAAGNTSEFSAPRAVHPTFETWAELNGLPSALRGDDPEADGLAHLIEYALGLTPLSANVPPPLTVLGNGSRELRLPKGSLAAQDPTLAYRFQTSTDLLNWSAPLPPTSETAAEAVFVLPVGPPRTFVRFAPTNP